MSGWLGCCSEGRQREHGYLQASNTWWPGGSHSQVMRMSQKENMFLFLLLIAQLYFIFVFFAASSNIHLLTNVCFHLLQFISWIACMPCPYSFSSALCFLLFYLVPVNRTVVQDLVITPGSVWFLADCCRVLYWPDAGLLSQAAGFAGRGTVLYLPECAHCHPLQRTPSILYFPARDLHPSVIPLSSVSQTEGL